MNSHLKNLGKKLKQVRNDKKLTLDQLSAMAGVSKAMLSQVEQGKVNPTVAVIMKISQSLGIRVSELLDADKKKNILRILRADEDVCVFRSDELCKIRTLSPLELEKDIEFYEVTLEANGQLVSESHFRDTEEILHLVKGRLVISSGGETATISKGNSIHYRADIPHSIENKGNSQALAYLIVRYKTNA